MPRVGLAAALALLAASPAQGRGRPSDLVLLKGDVKHGAVCLDGSPGAYYLRRGSGDGASKWLIFHEGGGWCSSLTSCLGRSKIDLGSSKAYPSQATFDWAYFSEDPEENPMMHNWNVAYLKYCDGSSFSGDNDTVTVVKGTQIHFRGRRVLSAMQRDLARKGLTNATDVVISGCSAGGLATFLHVDQWATFLQKGRKVPPTVVGMPDSGFFLDYEASPHYHTRMTWVFQQMNASAGVNQRCIQAHQATGDTWKCIFAQYAAPFIRTRIFPLQSAFDSYHMSSILGSNATDDVNAYGKRLASLLRGSVMRRASNGVFLDACTHHCGHAGWSQYYVGSQSQGRAFQAWYEGGSSKLRNHGFFWQKQYYPCKECCVKPAEAQSIISV